MSSATATEPARHAKSSPGAIRTLARVIPWTAVIGGWALTMTVTAIVVLTDAPSAVTAVALGTCVAVVVSTAVVPALIGSRMRALLRQPAGSSSSSAPTPPDRVPVWALALMDSEDARRYGAEWSAHLGQLIEEGEHKQARKDRRRLMVAGLTIAVVVRVRRLHRQPR